jgi:DNA-directed RNA polymerase III subunit RPC4
MSLSKPSSTAASFTHIPAPSPKREVDFNLNKEKVENLGDEEVYSDPDEGVEIVDMEDVRQMDWMAPESLRKERPARKIKKENALDGAGRIYLKFRVTS